MLSNLPKDVSRYSKSPVFSENTVPAALLKEHRTKGGVWGRLVVFKGSIDYIIPSVNEEKVRVTPSCHAIIEPEVLHYVSLVAPVEFQIEFYRENKRNDTGASK